MSFVAAWKISRRLANADVVGKNHDLGLWMAISASSTLLMLQPSIVMIFKLWTSIEFSDVIIAITYAAPG
ncbi:hypothetical protein NECAME_06492 [Necator americanus]|nr:hypothetical protein NECAME_06492 [Necator americanus]ETN85266.1 hypothetical protein NECAME_06492 [Necator americanus]